MKVLAIFVITLTIPMYGGWHFSGGSWAAVVCVFIAIFCSALIGGSLVLNHLQKNQLKLISQCFRAQDRVNRSFKERLNNLEAEKACLRH